jgi:hypothetical protein
MDLFRGRHEVIIIIVWVSNEINIFFTRSVARFVLRRT